jgi:outer membrane protein
LKGTHIMNRSYLSALVAVASIAGMSTAALAQGMTVKIGVTRVNPNSSASAFTGPFLPADTISAKVQSQSTLLLSISRDITPNWEVEFALGLPPAHDITLVVLKPSALPPSVAAQDGQVAARIKQVAPTVFANYKFGDVASTIRPYVGLGVNYTNFASPESTLLNNSINGGPTSMKFEDSMGLAFQVGVNVKISGPWSATLSWATAQVRTRATTNTLGVVRTADVSFSPSVASLLLGYSF